ncbi:hypothetical protein, partial [Chryseobacterium sp. SIMBA_029]|uniref:hypothetical protein n=1 Tax=Chryseobacterium sp. SIMBA_029 TaxID=3085772 RepID=UPI003979CE30
MVISFLADILSFYLYMKDVHRQAFTALHFNTTAGPGMMRLPLAPAKTSYFGMPGAAIWGNQRLLSLHSPIF